MISARRSGCVPAPPSWRPPSRLSRARFARAVCAMNRRDFAVLLLSLAPTACDWLKDKKQPLAGERISVLGLDTRFEPDPQLAGEAVTLPPPVANAEWPSPAAIRLMRWFTRPCRTSS